MVRRPRLSFALCALISGVVVSSAPGLAVGSAVAASDPPGIRAVRNGEAIDITDVARYHCHDRAYPIIRCFDTPAARDANERTVSSTGTSDSGAAETSAASSPYVRWYADIGFGGSSFVAYIGYANLGDIGWNDKITSFATYSGGHPRCSQNVGFGGTRWFGPNSTINNHYGNSYYYGALGGWYYHHPQGHSLYGYARRLSTGALYYEVY